MTLWLLPNLLGETASQAQGFPTALEDAVRGLDGLIAESEKGGRAFLRRFAFSPAKTWKEVPIRLLNEHTQEVASLLEPLVRGETWGLVSDAGLPCLADPGALLVRFAREKGCGVRALAGPSSPMLALMLSGLPAQSFAFHGYLHRDPIPQIRMLEKRSQAEGSTHLFIEAPYRNERLLRTLIATLSDSVVLAVACDLTLPTEQVTVLPVRTWKERSLPCIDKRPAVFLFCSEIKANA
jgi:16S rRNA (cytidine1402-2'-O)-methyltransferase